MTCKTFTHIGKYTLAEFDGLCRQIVREMAQGILRDFDSAEVMSKTGYDGVKDSDVVTTADLNAQQRLVAFAQAMLPPELGLIGEEGDLRRPSTFDGYTVILTADPLDGTRTFVEAKKTGRSLHPGQVSVMLGLLVQGTAVAGYICDVASLTTYYRAPFGETVWQVDSNGAKIDIATLPRLDSLASGYLLWHGTRPAKSPLTQRLVDSAIFGQVKRDMSSIGLSVMRTFDGRCIGMLRSAGGYITPWDDAPIQALCNQGDVVVLKLNHDYAKMTTLDPFDQTTPRDFDILYIPRWFLPELQEHVSVLSL
jgi:fructose-1,6-bisphosphatase/inositol monophosphatase family enzyme